MGYDIYFEKFCNTTFTCRERETERTCVKFANYYLRKVYRERDCCTTCCTHIKRNNIVKKQNMRQTENKYSYVDTIMFLAKNSSSVTCFCNTKITHFSYFFMFWHDIPFVEDSDLYYYNKGNAKWFIWCFRDKTIKLYTFDRRHKSEPNKRNNFSECVCGRHWKWFNTISIFFLF